MVSSVSLKTNNIFYPKNKMSTSNTSKPVLQPKKDISFCAAQLQPAKINTTLNEEQKKKYIYLVDFLKNMPISPNSENLSCNKQLDILLKNGKLLSTKSNDSTSTLDNLYDIATTERVDGLSAQNLISSTLDLLVNPKYITQNFGDIPLNEKKQILQTLPEESEVRKSPNLMDVEASGTCAAASIEVNMADKYPAEFARWISKLSSKNDKLLIDVNLKSLSQNTLDAITILDLFEANKVNFNLNKTTISADLDNGAYTRAKIQEKYWNPGERNTADVLIQSAIMRLGSQNTYDSLTDIRAGKFNLNPQGLIEIEKTFVESIVKNKEITSLTYQKIDDNQNLTGYNCSFDKIEKHITDSIDQGNDVIVGYVLTNETSGRTKSRYYSQINEGKPEKVINGHEITIVDYEKDSKGNINFICIDTDDDNPEYVKYSAQWLLPKIHHAGYPAKLVEHDEKEIMKNVA